MNAAQFFSVRSFCKLTGYTPFNKLLHIERRGFDQALHSRRARASLSEQLYMFSSSTEEKKHTQHCADRPCQPPANHRIHAARLWVLSLVSLPGSTRDSGQWI